MIPVSYVCFVSPSGYSQAAQDLIFALHASGEYDVRVVPLGDVRTGGMSQRRRAVLTSLMAKPHVPEAVQVYHCIPDAQRRVARLKRSIGFATFETYGPPPHWAKILNQNTAVACPSLFNVRVFGDAGVVRPTFHLPHCVDTSLFRPDVRPLSESDLFTFLFFGAWKERKGWKQLMEAWFEEFGPHDGVRLVVKSDDEARVRGDVELLRRNLGLSGKESAPVLVESNIFDEASLPRFLKSADCLVFPTLGEGFGLPPLQCMALGVPVICTAHSGCADFVSEETATPLHPQGFMVRTLMDNIKQFTNRTWAHVPVAQIRSSMRMAVTNVDKTREKAIRAAELVAQKYCYQRAVADFSTVVNSI